MESSNDAAAWMRAGDDAQIVASMLEVYEDVARRIAERGPACWASGRCCSFETSGHRLYVTGVEVALTVRGVAGESSASGSGGVALTSESLADAVSRGGCPFQVGNLCGAHPHRPLGCRVYFCDRSAQDWQQSLYEKALARVRRIHESHAIPYRYGEWRSMLGAVLEAGFSS